MAGLCWFHCRLRLCRRKGMGGGGSMLASLEADIV